jgi:hypothetical protein
VLRQSIGRTNYNWIQKRSATRASDLLADKFEFDAGNDDKGGIDIEFDEGLEKSRKQSQKQGPNVNYYINLQY